MQSIQQLLSGLTARLGELARSNAVVARKVSVGERHVIPLCELSLGFGGGGGDGEGSEPSKGDSSGKGSAAGAGGAAKATPVAVIVVDNGRVRIESLGQ